MKKRYILSYTYNTNSMMHYANSIPVGIFKTEDAAWAHVTFIGDDPVDYTVEEVDSYE